MAKWISRIKFFFLITSCLISLTPVQAMDWDTFAKRKLEALKALRNYSPQVQEQVIQIAALYQKYKSIYYQLPNSAVSDLAEIRSRMIEALTQLIPDLDRYLKQKFSGLDVNLHDAELELSFLFREVILDKNQPLNLRFYAWLSAGDWLDARGKRIAKVALTKLGSEFLPELKGDKTKNLKMYLNFLRDCAQP